MKNIPGGITLIIFLLVTNCYSQKYSGELAKTEFNCSGDKMHFFIHFFETKKQVVDFMNIKNGDCVSEIGAANSENIGFLSLLTENVTYYAQDIDAKTLTQKRLNKTIMKYSKLKQSKQTNSFQRVIGTKNSSNLPDGKFDKILIIDSFHDFDKKDEMIDDVAKKLKPDGQFIIIDGFSFVGDTQTCPDYGVHVLTVLNVEIKRFENHGFYLIKMRSPDCFAAHYGNGLVFEKNKEKSVEFYKVKNEIDPLINESIRLKQKGIASDTLAIKKIVDILLPKINDINFVYNEYEMWLKEIAFTYLRKSDYQPAINILRANTLLYPKSYQTFYWLGVAYQENKQYKLAMQNFKLSLSLQPINEVCTNRIKKIEKLQ